MQRNYASLNGKVIGLEKQIKEAKEKLRSTLDSEIAAREATMLEVRQQAISNFKQSEEYTQAT